MCRVYISNNLISKIVNDDEIPIIETQFPYIDFPEKNYSMDDLGVNMVDGMVNISVLPQRTTIAVKIQKILDSKAQEFGYDSIMSAISYLGDPINITFANEATAFKEWRSRVWTYAIENQNSETPLAELMANIPKFPLTKSS